jgi:hypothetical protein
MGGIVAFFNSLPLLFVIVVALIVAAIIGVISVIVTIIKMSIAKKARSK